MPAQNIGIVYSTGQQVIRRVIDTRWLGNDKNGKLISDPNADDSLLKIHQNSIVSGEAWALVPCDTYDKHTTALQTHQFLGLTGIPGITDRCIVYAANAVVAICNADPSIDTHPAGTIAFDTTAKASPGYQVSNGTAVIPVSVSGSDLHPAQQAGI